MKKHFLLLMLMALLPLAGWAEDISSASVAVGNIVKGTVAPGAPFVVWEGETLTSADPNPQYTVDENYYTRSGEEGNYTYTSVGSNLSARPIGTYYVKITGVPENGFNGVAYGEFKITKKPLTIDFTGVDATYGDAPTAVTYKVYDGETWLNPNDENEAKAAVATVIISSLEIQAVTKSGENVIEITNTTGVGNYDFDFSYNEEDDCDYTLTRAVDDEDQYVINPKDINTEGMAVEMGAPGTYNYTGDAITGLPTFTVTDGETNVTTFDVKWFAEALSNEPETSDDAAVIPTNAGTYYARVTGTGNYAGKVFNNDDWKITVNPAALTVLVNPKSKTYDGVAYTTADVEYTFGGLVDADQGKVNLASLTPTKDGAAWADFKDYKEGGYTIGVNVDEATIGAEPVIALNTNYTVTPVSSVWTINKISGLKISAANKTINFGDDVPVTSEITATGALEAEKAAIEALYVAPAEGGVNNVYGTQPAIYTPALKEVGEGGYESADAKAEAEAVLANYTFADPAIVAGNLSVGGQNAMIMPIVASVIYDGQAHAATGYSATSGAYILTEWDEEAEAGDIDVTNISYMYKKQNPEDLTWSEYSTTVPSTVGVYRAQVAATSISGKGNFAGAEIARPEVQFEIQARPITITVTGATLHKGDLEANLEGHTLYTKEGSYVEGENVVLKPVFVTPTAEGLILDEDTKKVTTNPTAEPIADAVVMTDDVEGDNDNANYAFTFVAGPLTIAASELVLDPTDATLATKIAEAAATGENYQITFANNATLNANEWYAVVLPFATTPKELVNKLGEYVIVNRLRSSSMENGQVDVKFTLDMQEIPAGEPFLIKAAKEVDWDIICVTEEAHQEGPIIDGPDADAPAPAVVLVNDNSILVEADNLKGDIDDVETDYATFTGTYEIGNSVKWYKGLDGTTDDADAKYRWLAHKEYKGDNNWKNPKTNAHDLIPMEAYLVLDPAAQKARVFVEELNEDGTTAIKSISAEEIHGLTVDGMYNLQGVKLQSAPTQKGVYINNGKKVIIK